MICSVCGGSHFNVGASVNTGFHEVRTHAVEFPSALAFAACKDR